MCTEAVAGGADCQNYYTTTKLFNFLAAAEYTGGNSPPPPPRNLQWVAAVVVGVVVVVVVVAMPTGPLGPDLNRIAGMGLQIVPVTSGLVILIPKSLAKAMDQILTLGPRAHYAFATCSFILVKMKRALFQSLKKGTLNVDKCRSKHLPIEGMH